METPCYVCGEVCKNNVKLDTAFTPILKINLPERISQLVGEQFVVVVTELDVICKRCVSLIVHLDKLENEFLLAKEAIVRRVKEYYDLSQDIDSSKPAKILEKGALKEKGETSVKTENIEEKLTSNKIIVSPSSLSLTSTAVQWKKPGPKSKDSRVLKSAIENANKTPIKTKVFKCGFCSFQSKQLINVRDHMKSHIKCCPEGSNRSSMSSIPSSARTAGSMQVTNAATIEKPDMPPPPIPPKRRLFRCQVCSISYDDKMKCLAHIKKEHADIAQKQGEAKATEKRNAQHVSVNDNNNSNINNIVNLSVSKSDLNVELPITSTNAIMQSVASLIAGKNNKV